MAFNISEYTTSISEIVMAILQLIKGRGNYIGDVTLIPGTTTTAVSFENCSKDCRVFLTPQTAAASAMQWRCGPADIGQGGFVFHHTVAPADASFSFACIGG